MKKHGKTVLFISFAIQGLNFKTQRVGTVIENVAKSHVNCKS